MLNFRKILVARDFSPCSDAALAYALKLAERSGAEVHTLFAEVIHGPSAPPVDVRRSTSTAGRKHISEEVVVRDVAEGPAVVGYAEAQGIDLIVLGTHGRRGLRRLFMGSVAEEVVRMSRCSVLTVRCAEAGNAAGIDDILVPIDFSRYSREALREAVSLASEYSVALDLLHVIEEPLHPAFYNTGVFSIYDIQPDIEIRVEDQLRSIFADVGSEGLTVRYHVRPGHAAREIVAFASEHRSSLIVTSSHGLTGLEHLFIGSVAEKVVRTAPCPVLTVKPARFNLTAPLQNHAEAVH